MKGALLQKGAEARQTASVDFAKNELGKRTHMKAFWSRFLLAFTVVALGVRTAFAAVPSFSGTSGTKPPEYNPVPVISAPTAEKPKASWRKELDQKQITDAAERWRSSDKALAGNSQIQKVFDQQLGKFKLSARTAVYKDTLYFVCTGVDRIYCSSQDGGLFSIAAGFAARNEGQECLNKPSMAITSTGLLAIAADAFRHIYIIDLNKEDHPMFTLSLALLLPGGRIFNPVIRADDDRVYVSGSNTDRIFVFGGDPITYIGEYQKSKLPKKVRALFETESERKI